MRLLFILGCAIAASATSYWGQPLLKDNGDAITIITTVITVFAGFLVAIIAVLGDPAVIPSKSWRAAETRHQKLERELIRNKWLFYMYLITIGLLFAATLLKRSRVSDEWKTWFENLYLFFGSFSFFLTLALPCVLTELQKARSESEIERRRMEVGIKPP